MLDALERRHEFNGASAPVDELSTDDEGTGLYLRFLKTGDIGAFEELHDLYKNSLFGYLRKYLGHYHDAECAAQETWMKVSTRTSLFTEGKRFKPWLYAIATHSAIDIKRRNGRRMSKEIFFSDIAPSHGVNTEDHDLTFFERYCARISDFEAIFGMRERAKIVARNVEMLPEIFRGVVFMIMQGYKFEDVAETLKIPVGTVKSRHWKAKQLLRDTFDVAIEELAS
jgi:RNA polymerase sigma-70 factor (ECF subfamily)